MDKPLKYSVTHGQCDARPTVTFPAAFHIRPAHHTELFQDHGTSRWTADAEWRSSGWSVEDVARASDGSVEPTPFIAGHQIIEGGSKINFSNARTIVLTLNII